MFRSNFFGAIQPFHYRAKALALLPYTGDDTEFHPLPRRVESVLVKPRGVAAQGRPATQSVMEA